MRPVSLVSVSLLCPVGIGVPGAAHGAATGHVPGFDPLKLGVPRKHLKTMTRAVQLGVAGVHLALEGAEGWMEVPPERRGLYVGASPQSGDAEDLAPALGAVGRPGSVAAFAERGIPLIPPLWLVKGLSNNILGYASAQHDLQGDNGNWCDGRHGGAVALTNAARAVAEGRVDIAIAGGADALVDMGTFLGRPAGEGAAFVVLRAGEGGPRVTAGVPVDDAPDEGLGELGAAAVPVAWVRRFLRGERGFSVGGLTVHGA